jgi:hypothetical protein
LWSELLCCLYSLERYSGSTGHIIILASQLTQILAERFDMMVPSQRHIRKAPPCRKSAFPNNNQNLQILIQYNIIYILILLCSASLSAVSSQQNQFDRVWVLLGVFLSIRWKWLFRPFVPRVGNTLTSVSPPPGGCQPPRMDALNIRCQIHFCVVPDLVGLLPMNRRQLKTMTSPYE